MASNCKSLNGVFANKHIVYVSAYNNL
jgi:hypothetical protein